MIFLVGFKTNIINIYKEPGIEPGSFLFNPSFIPYYYRGIVTIKKTFG